ncbi:hypothetical protein ABT340_16210 [Streptosporangium sp. NPDC000239]|uniref:hypothetical protein n=1 Tax=Streptosporangium sp. NPDC000239 TaxID=3154248 RepID=UPI003325FC81
MTDVATTSTCRRVAALESWAFRTGSDLAGIKGTLGNLPVIIREEIMTYTSPVLEEIMNRMATGDDLVALTARVDGLETEVRNLGVRVGGLETKVDRLDAKVDGLESRMTALETKVDSLEAEVRGLGGRMDAMEKRMDSMDDKLDLILAKLG